MKRKLIGLILITSLLLVGCGEDLDAMSQSKEASHNVSTDLLLEAHDYISTLPDYFDPIYDYLDRITDYPYLVGDRYFKEAFIGAIDEYHTYLSGMDASPSTALDFEADEHFSEILEQMLLGLENLRTFVETEDVKFLGLSADYFDEAKAAHVELNYVLKMNE